MAKKIIILNGSPRPKGNTSALTAEFKRGAEETGNEAVELQLSRMKTNGRIGCWRGGKDPDHPCTQRDDMEKIYPVYREADVVVLASPLHYRFISSFPKNAFDRLFAIAESDPNYRNPKKESILIMAAEGAGFEESEHWYGHLGRHIGWKSLGKVLCGYVTQPGGAQGKKELEDAYNLGKSIQQVARSQHDRGDDGTGRLRQRVLRGCQGTLILYVARKGSAVHRMESPQAGSCSG